MRLTDVLHAVDAHAEGELTRVVVGGLPRVCGEQTMAEKRRTLMSERRFYAAISSASRMVTSACMRSACFRPSDPAADAGIVIMEATDYPAMSGSNAICAATVLLETGMVPMVGAG